jgi:hypothetical protein
VAYLYPADCAWAINTILGVWETLHNSTIRFTLHKTDLLLQWLLQDVAVWLAKMP